MSAAAFFMREIKLIFLVGYPPVLTARMFGFINRVESKEIWPQ